MSKGNKGLLTSAKNDTRAQQRLDMFLNQQSSKSCIIFDFDECLINTHLSSQLTIEYIDRIDSRMVNFSDHSLAGIEKILRCYVGLNRSEIISTCRRLATKTRWRPYALALLKFLTSTPDYRVLIISSGLNLPIDAKVLSSGLSIPRIACEMEFSEVDVCVRPYLVITGDIKGLLAQRVVNSGRFERVFVVGHSHGDVEMLRAGIGIALKGVHEVEQSAQYVVSGFKEIFPLVK